MSRELTIFKNSFFLTAQPVMMNVISVLVTVYMARQLGPSDFGTFNFVLSFIMLFYPIAIMGLNRVTVREMAGLQSPREYGSKMIMLRGMTTGVAVVSIWVVTYLMGYENRMRDAIWWGSLIFLFQLLYETLADIFNAHEKMQFTALTNSVMGFVITSSSLILLYLGHGLFGLIAAYAFGNFFAFAVAVILLQRYFFKFQPTFDAVFSKEKLRTGISFFLMSLMWFFISRLDLVVLSKTSDAQVLGIYTAGLLIVPKLAFVAQAFTSSILPTATKMFKEGEIEELKTLTKRIFTILFMLLLPAGAAISFYSKEITNLIFDQRYAGSSLILSIAVWTFPIICISSAQFAILTAVGKHGKLLQSYLIATGYCILANAVLTVKFGAIGAVACFVSTPLLLLVLFSLHTVRAGYNPFNSSALVKIVTATVLMIGLSEILVRMNWTFDGFGQLGIPGQFTETAAKLSFVVSATIAGLAYLIFIVGLRLIQMKDLVNLRRVLVSR